MKDFYYYFFLRNLAYFIFRNFREIRQRLSEKVSPFQKKKKKKKNVQIIQKNDHFVCVEVLQPSQPNGVMSGAVSLPNHTFTGQA